MVPVARWKTRNDPNQAGFGKHYETSQPQYPGIKRHASGMDLAASPRSVDSMKTPGSSAPTKVQEYQCPNCGAMNSMYPVNYRYLMECSECHRRYTRNQLDQAWGRVHLHPSPGAVQLTLQEKKAIYSEQQPVMYRGNIGEKDTELFAGKVSQAEVEDLVGSFERLPPRAQAEIQRLEIYPEPGHKRKAGSYEFLEGGHWSVRDKTVRVFGSKGGERWIGFEKTDDIMAHEAGHALWDKIENQAYSEKYPHEEAAKLIEQADDARHRERERIMAAHEPAIEALWQQHQKKLDEGMHTWDLEEMRKRRREDQAIMRKMGKLQKIRDAELDEMRKKYDAELVLAQLEREKQPTFTRVREFRTASHEEGGITSYAHAWKGENTFDTENFAECMKIFYSGHLPESRVERYRKDFPKTHRAFQALVEPEVAGHAVSLEKKPKMSSWREWERRTGNGETRSSPAARIPKLTAEHRDLLGAIRERGFRVDVVNVCIEHKALRELNQMGLVELSKSDQMNPEHQRLEHGHIVNWELTPKGKTIAEEIEKENA